MPEAPEQILLVEDNDDDAFLFESAFKRLHITNPVHREANGEKAVQFLELVKSGKEPVPKLVLLDLKMPFMDGFEVLESIRSCSELSSLKVIIFSSSDLEVDRHRAEVLGANAYLVKPMGFQEYDNLILELKETWLKN